MFLVRSLHHLTRYTAARSARPTHDHQRTANLLQKYSIETLPVVMEHLEMAKEQYALLTMGAGKPR
jgi:hypothetical protein